MLNGLRRMALAGLALGSFWASAAPVVAAPPVVPGVDRLKPGDPARGELLLGELNCISCHAAPDAQRIIPRQAPDLTQVGSRVTPQFLTAYLADPQSVKPGTAMPNVFHASEPAAKQGAVEFLTHYLVSLGGPIKTSTEEGSQPQIDAGDRLFHTVGCVACHSPVTKTGKPIDTKLPSVPLGNLASKTTVDQLTKFLLDPHKARPSGRMPQLSLTSDEAKSIAVYLLRDQLSNPAAKDAPLMAVAGLRYSYWEKEVPDCKIETLDALGAPKSAGRVKKIDLKIPGLRNQNYAIKFSGQIDIEKDGKYTFHTESDDGSRVYIDGKSVVDNDGIHPPSKKSGTIELKKGSHAFAVTFFQGGGGAEFKVEWQGPGFKKSAIPADVLASVDGKPMIPLGSEPFTVDPGKAQMGKQMFSVLGCAACHNIPAQKSMRPYKPLAELNMESVEGCLGDNIRKGVPKYDLSADQRTAIKTTLKDKPALAKALTPKEQVSHSMAALNCYACHKRDDIGGPSEDRAGYFTMTAEFDMGEEGTIPPVLTGVGNKLKPAALGQIVNEGKLHIRQVLATRMPVFQKPQTEALLTALPVVDTAAAAAPAEPKFEEKSAKDGRVLFGVKGLGCVNCHGVLGTKSLGMPAPDLTTAHERLTYTWYSKLMHDPTSINPGTRMPGFWPGGVVAVKGLGGDTADGQINAMWDYLSLGSSMALPAGLAPTGRSELVAVDEPVLHRTFFAGVGPRALLVGYPEQLNVAFDGNLVRLATVWRGRFFDPAGMWDGRGGKANGPLGSATVELPATATFATLASPGDPWPVPTKNPDDGDVARNIGGKFLGYDLDADKRPTFRYSQAGVEIREQPVPRLQPGGVQLVRKFELTGKAEKFHMLAGQGKSIEEKSPGEYVIDGKQTIRLPAGLKATIREDAGGKQLIVPIDLSSGKAAFSVEMSW
ncbi:PA14 domain-containing protein [Humisphaera borealis]|uniref:C-type cytochrome n=1 Tax=Humisphaera borealis TaxID=2807512 RepID=A0A7M2WRD0_9BACT|nr:PA14 domain-containing protein [Humisphaera borealis]QOV87702.1 c-type cytochrome [Humisphaera borealis]